MENTNLEILRELDCNTLSVSDPWVGSTYACYYVYLPPGRHSQPASVMFPFACLLTLKFP